MVAARPTPGGGFDHAVLDGKPLLILVLAPQLAGLEIGDKELKCC